MAKGRTGLKLQRVSIRCRVMQFWGDALGNDQPEEALQRHDGLPSMAATLTALQAV